MDIIVKQAVVPPSHMSGPLSEFFASRNMDSRASSKWLAKLKCKELFFALLEKRILHKNYIFDWESFTKSLDTLNENPYIRQVYGEAPQHLLAVRDMVRSVSTKATENTPPELLQAKRINFAAWALWQQQKNKVFLPLRNICAYAHTVDIDIDDMLKYMTKHHSNPSMYTYQSISKAESNITEMLKESTSFNLHHTNVDTLDLTQNNTICKILNTPCSILQGGAGVGKTTTVSSLIKTILRHDFVDVYCLAFTHKAKRCLQDKLNCEHPKLFVSTIHSFVKTLQKMPSEGSIASSFLVIDEASMIDIELMGELAEMLLTRCEKNGFQILFIGDDMQLPPIGRGEVFRFLVQQSFNVNKLVKCYRVEKPDLFAAYQMIRAGKLPTTSENVNVKIVSDDKDINVQIGRIINKDFNPQTTQIIAWQNKDVFKINKWVQAYLLKARIVGPKTWKGFYQNDSVVYCGDNGDECTNAMTGKVAQIGTNSMTVEWCTGKMSTYNTETRDVQLAYCLTVHKFQGSEYDNIIVPCYDVSKMMMCLDRRWLYTAATRAKQNLQIIATADIASFLSADVRALPLTNVKTNII